MCKFAPISVIVPCYRCDQTIARAIFSVVNQSMLPSEILLIEDCSEDDGKTRQALFYVQNLYPQSNIRIIFLQQNSGPSKARNVGWQNASQPYIAFLDADDSWHLDKLKIQYSWMRAHPDVLVTAHQSVKFSPDFKKTLSTSPEVFELNKLKFYFHNPISLRSVMLRKSMSHRFNSSFRGTEDYLLWFEMTLDSIKIFYIESVLSFSYKNDYGEGGLNGNLWASYCGVLKVYKHLYRSKKINLIWFLLSSFIATLLFSKRLAVVFIRKLSDIL